MDNRQMKLCTCHDMLHTHSPNGCWQFNITPATPLRLRPRPPQPKWQRLIAAVASRFCFCSWCRWCCSCCCSSNFYLPCGQFEWYDHCDINTDSVFCFQGLPLHVQIDTFEDPRDTAVFHRGYCQIKVFCDKVSDFIFPRPSRLIPKPDATESTSRAPLCWQLRTQKQQEPLCSLCHVQQVDELTKSDYVLLPLHYTGRKSNKWKRRKTN